MTAETTSSPFTETSGQARHAAFAELAASGPVQRVPMFTGVPAWVATGYAEARKLLADQAVVKTEGGGPHMDAMPEELMSAMNTHLLGTNPPDHTRLRRLVTAAFTARRVEALAPRVQQIADELLDDLAVAGADRTPVDLVMGFGFPLPMTVITELLGIPPGDRSDFRRWSSIAVNGTVHPPETYVAAARGMVDYIRGLIDAKRAEPRDDLLSALIAVQEDGDRLSQDELTSMVFLLLVAGHETTVNLIVNGTLALLRHPDQLQLLRAEPERLPAAIEELLRYDGPLQAPVPSVTAAPVEVGGVTIPAGETVLPALLAANRDPAHTAEPDRLDITRTPSPHLAFGHGLHHCLGAALARLEGRIAIGSLLARFPRLQLADADTEPARNPSLIMNGVVELPVVLG